MRTPSPLIGLVAFACSTQAVAQTEPLDATARPAAAEATIADLEARLRADPENSDLLRRLAAAQAAAGDLTSALATIDRAAAIAPEDNDVLLARARILLWSGRSSEAREQSEVVAARDPTYPELADLKRAVVRAERGSRAGQGGLALSAGVSEIEFDRGGSSTWKTLGAAAFLRPDQRSTLSTSMDYEKRASADVRFELRGERQIGKGRAFLAASVTPSADFREKYSVTVGGELPLLQMLDLLLDLRHADYGTNEITTLRPAIRWRATPQLVLTAQWINLFEEAGGSRSGVSGRADYALSDGSGLFLGAAIYPDTEAGITRQVRSVFAGGSFPLSDRLTLRAAAEYERRDMSYKRKALTIGLGWRFGG